MIKYKLIIVENDEDEQFFMKEGFDVAGVFEIVSQLKNGDALFEWLEEHKPSLPDVILSDLNMPGKNGYDILEGIKADPAYRHIPVIITSTSSAKVMIDRCLKLGASGYMVKPDTFIAYAAFANDLYKLIQEQQLVK
ncbi:response regulator [Flavisolibacter tropicus]|uniref:Response regulator receiver protein n=1 Tax=Flavisolibacter tropicus TaxID=1492898 RepID=A0A172TTS2_9BACT|nr:response regulator [Flavisolibacter tropicus]ANE50430.1 response regulator receiver protein [Flavisolibacter tropicus]